MESLASAMIACVSAEMAPGTEVATAGELQNTPKVTRPLRFIHRFQKKHITSTDVILSSEGRDLYVRVMEKSKTPLAYLKYIWFAGMFLVGSLVILAIYLAISGAKQNWVQDYAQREAPLRWPIGVFGDRSAFVTRCFLEGYYETDWSRVRSLLEQDKNALNQFISMLREEAQEYDPAGVFRREAADDLSSMLQAMNSVGKGLILNGAIQQEAGGPELIAELRLKNFRDDETATWYERGTERNMNPFLYEDLARQHLLSTTWLESVELFGFFEGFDGVINIVERSTTHHPPISYFTLLRSDPKGSLMHLLTPLGIIGGIVGFIVWRTPKAWLRYPCRFLGWITPEDFNSQSMARTGRVVRLLSLTLHEYGFDRSKISELGVSNDKQS